LEKNIQINQSIIASKFGSSEKITSLSLQKETSF